MCRIANPTQRPALRTSPRTDVLLLFLGGVFFVFLGDGEGRDFLTFELTFGPNPHQTHIRLTSDSHQTHVKPTHFLEMLKNGAGGVEKF